MFSKSSKFKSLVSGFLVIVPVLLSAAVHAENCPDPLSMEFQAGQDGQTGKYVVPGTDWKSNEGYPELDNSSFVFSGVYFLQIKNGPDQIWKCEYITDSPSLANAEQMAPIKISLTPPVNNKSTISGANWINEYESDSAILYRCQGDTDGELPDAAKCNFALSFQYPPSYIPKNPFAKK